MSKLAVVFMFLLLPSCSIVEKAERILDDAQIILDDTKEFVGGSKAIIANADTDNSGKVDQKEMWAVIASVIALGIKVFTDSKKRSASTKELHAKSNDLKVEVAAMRRSVPGMTLTGSGGA